MSRNKNIDWEKIEKLYRLGQLSMREIAAQCETHASSITRRAEKEGWTQDLRELVQQKINATLISNTNATPTKADIEVAVASAVEAVRSHRRTIGSTWKIVNTLTTQLREVVDNRAEIESDIEGETAGDESQARRARMMRAVSLGSNVMVLKDLSVAQKNVVSLERQAFGLSDGDDPAPKTPSVSDDRAVEYARNDGLLDKLNAALATRNS